jgi:hypothetical protein
LDPEPNLQRLPDVTAVAIVLPEELKCVRGNVPDAGSMAQYLRASTGYGRTIANRIYNEAVVLKIAGIRPWAWTVNNASRHRSFSRTKLVEIMEESAGKRL